VFAATVWGGLAAASLLIGFVFAGRGLSSRTIGNVMGLGAGAMLADAMMPEAFAHGGKAVGLFTVLGFLMAGMLSVAQ
jgi:zinc transporter, ZIP family